MDGQGPGLGWTYLHDHEVGMLEMELRGTLSVVNTALGYDLTLYWSPIHVQAADHEMLLPLELTSVVHCSPESAASRPQRLL